MVGDLLLKMINKGSQKMERRPKISRNTTPLVVEYGVIIASGKACWRGFKSLSLVVKMLLLNIFAL